jgi:hypothetical protein
MKRTARQVLRASLLAAVCASLSIFVQSAARAQSTDLGSPTPVYGPEISGRIAPLDVGDPRRTRHFYTFNARPGDLELAVEANNLDGDIELFTAAAMRPLAQVTLYSGLGSNVARTIFFRADAAVVLRVQARSPNDAEGTYRIRLGGTFAPSTLPPLAESASNAAKPAHERLADKGVRRVNSIGARIEEPKTETPPASERAETTPAPSEATPRPATTAKTAPARNAASNRATPPRRGAARRGTTPRTTAPTAEAAKAETANTEPGKTQTKAETAERATSGEPARGESTRSEPAARTAANANRARANRTRGARTNAGAASRPANGSESPGKSAAGANESSSNASTATPAAGATGLEAPGARVVLEMRDGTRVERAMSDVRRVAVEGSFVVIVFRNGRVERHPLADVQRMAIEP